MKKILVAAFTIVAGVVVRAGVPLTPAYTEPVLVISVESDTTLDQWLSDSGKTLDGVKTIVKKGAGKLVSNRDISASFAGDIVVAAGYLSIGITGALGDNTGVAYVLDGATLVLEPNAGLTDAGFNFKSKNFVLAGRGVGSTGADSDVGSLTRGNVTYWMKSGLGKIHLAADTLITMPGSSQDIRPEGEFHLNGKTLSLYHGATYRMWEFGRAKLYGPGTISIVRGRLFPAEITCYNDSTEPFELVLHSGATFRPWGTCGTTDTCTLVMKEGSIMTIAGDSGETTVYNNWQGPVRLEGHVKIELYSYTKAYSLNLYGKVSGAFSLDAATQDNKGCGYLKLHNAGNDFTGGITTWNGYVDLYADGAAPSDGGAVTLTNGQLRLFSDGAWTLPALHASGTSGFKSVGGGVPHSSGALGEETYDWTYGTLKDAVVKEGEGELAYDSIYGAPLLDVRGGGVKFCFKQTTFGPAGLYAGYTVTNAAGWKADRETQAGFYTDTESYKRINEVWKGEGTNPNYMTFAPHIVDHIQIGDKIPGSDGSEPLASNGWGKFPAVSVWTYKGYIWNRTGATQTWSVLAHSENRIAVYLDGELIVESFGYNSTGTNDTVTVTPGAHEFYYQQVSENGWGGANLRGDFGGFTLEKGSFVIDRAGRGTHNYADYERLVDPGDGSVLTLTADPAQLPKKVPSFDAMRFAQGTYLDAGGNDVTVPELTGYPEIRNGNLTVTGSFNLEAAMAIGCASVNGALTFANGCTFSVDDTKALRKKFRDAGKSFPCVIAEADEIVGCPKSADNQWTVSVSADGKQLLLNYRPKGLTVIIR